MMSKLVLLMGGAKDLIAWGGAAFALDLIEARAYGDGAVLHVYRPARLRFT
jgi:hypothetical protein